MPQIRDKPLNTLLFEKADKNMPSRNIFLTKYSVILKVASADQKTEKKKERQMKMTERTRELEQRRKIIMRIVMLKKKRI